MTAGGDQLNGGFEAVSEFTRAAIAEGAALKQHQAFAAGEGRCSRFLEGLEGLARFSAIEAAEVEAAPAWIDAALDQAVDGPIPRCRVISPDQMDRHGLMMAGMAQDHPIFTESIRRIRELLGDTGLQPLEQEVLERLVHSSGDPSIAELLRFSTGACEVGLAALRAGAVILTDTEMAAAAIRPMVSRTLRGSVRCLLEWAPDQAPIGSTRTATGMVAAWGELSGMRPAPVVLFGSAPTAMEVLLNLVSDGSAVPSLVIGMPVGFVGVAESKRHLAESGLVQIRLEGSRGGAGLVGAAVNALLRAAG